ncbi:MAG: F0F1 ATP synthase subunit A [Lachnospiraceae bacterium]|nr:F0F1 ATP synthase subunit A [Lachnospiraceae bacterium]MBQ8117666.1 F0F1 ATP synthase subunit A [Lachnospiraceae bacterium]
MTYGILLSGSSDVDVMVHGLLKYNFFGHEVWLTTTHVSLLLVVLILCGFSIAAGRAIRKGTDVPGNFQNVVELIVEKLCGMVDSTMSNSAPRFYNYIGTIFIFILFSNISGLLGLRPPTADYGVTFPLGVLTFILIHFNQFKYQKPKDIWADMCSPLPPWLPIWFPINVISEIAVPISLSLRLFANILSGTIMMALIYGLLGVIATAWPAALHVYFDLFSGAIQTYVFCMLTMTYIKNAIGDAV